ncbi:hypothetical protein [Lacibacter sediminis]|uniref:Uncharacterized protein n=1 Tax=Lacibacter sediminis TaxID=2760713 RepID=A0A7G5XKD2_9BACT|nr:hypothetical protein [Lacibacter sediminis]QNA45935.1 hypothetical protein H4075_07025 [Lacibacter sediminis]
MYLKFSFIIAVFYFTIATGCRKQAELLPVVPSIVDSSSYLQLTFNGMQPNLGTMYAILSITKENGDSVFTNRKVAITQSNQQYISEKIKLGKNSYKLAKLVVVKSSDTAKFATPQLQSAKAGLVNVALPLPVNITSAGVHAVQLSVLPVSLSEDPSSFGYTTADFGFEAYFTLQAHLQMKVGDVGYDSLPGLLKLEAVKLNGDRWLREIELRKGITLVQVPQEYDNYTFTITKWNTSIQKQYNRAELNNNMLVSLAGTRSAKRLVEESVFIENSGALTADSRSEYFYNQNGKLKIIRYYQRSLQFSGLPLTFVYNFQYSQPNAWDTVYRYDANQQLTGFTAMERTNNGHIHSMFNKSYDQHTGAAVSYSVVNGNKEITVDYLFSNNNSMRYNIKFEHGNKVEDRGQSSIGGAESGTYSYDAFINPYHQLGYDDMYFTNASKNNLMSMSKGYAGGFPTVIPYRYEYVYDEDGYPKESFVSYKGYSSQQHLYRIKKVFRYQ